VRGDIERVVRGDIERVVRGRLCAHWWTVFNHARSTEHNLSSALQVARDRNTEAGCLEVAGAPTV
jgi:hypothetical protein